MLTSFEDICRIARKTIRQSYETDPFRICKALGIIMLYVPMGNYPEACKGFFLAQSRKLSITINSDIPASLQRIICAHELGHGRLHRNCSDIKAFHDFALFDETSHYEYEANIFAAELLLDDADVLEALNDDLSFFQAAQSLRVPAEILDFKFRIMKQKGYEIVEPPIVSNGNFLKNVDIPENHDDVC